LAWIWPGGLVLALDLVLTTWWADAPWLSELAFKYVWVVLGAGGLLAWRFRRSRVVAVVGLLTLLALVPPLERVLEGPGPWEAVGAFSILAISLSSIGRDRGILSPIGLIQIVAVLFGGWVAMATADFSPGTWAWLDAFSLGGFGPQVARVLLPLLLAGLTVAVVQALRREHPVERGLAWSAVAVFLAVTSLPGSVEALTHILAAAVILTLTVVETSYGLAFRDELTGLPTRRALWQSFDSTGSTYAMAMVDVDHFKKFNDRHGHDVGDQVLKMVAGRLARVAGGGKAFRYGGEEFTVVFPGKTRDEALPFLEELREKVEESRFSVRRMGRPRKKPTAGGKASRRSPKKEPRELSVTVSIGVAERSEAAVDPEAVIKAADRALYRAKKAGRNRVTR
jgi:diguanylate cyclase (GGDEF)-like protein